MPCADDVVECLFGLMGIRTCDDRCDQVGDSEWSEALSIGTSAAGGPFDIQDLRTSALYALTYQVQPQSSETAVDSERACDRQ